ncbi:MAG: hypothetical protein QOF12_287, partial [Solirubrobacteraceae bacterium]|nr:hypothetical protein [Solirubrobacteraceae bacterium]
MSHRRRIAPALALAAAAAFAIPASASAGLLVASASDCAPQTS